MVRKAAFEILLTTVQLHSRQYIMKRIEWAPKIT